MKLESHVRAPQPKRDNLASSIIATVLVCVALLPAFTILLIAVASLMPGAMSALVAIAAISGVPIAAAFCAAPIYKWFRRRL